MYARLPATGPARHPVQRDHFRSPKNTERGRNMAKAAAKAGAKKASNKLTKAGLITALADTLGEASSRKAVKATLEALNDIATKELKKNKVFVLPGFAKFVIATRA